MVKGFGLVISLLVAGGLLSQPANSQSDSSPITIIGERMLINGVQQDLTCVFNGRNNAATIDWVLVVGTLMPTQISASNTNELVLSLHPEPDLDGVQFKCVVMDTLGVTFEETITLSVKDLKHTLNITVSHDNPVVAGTSLTLTCIAVTSRPAHLTWQDPEGNNISSTASLTVSAPVVSGENTTITLTFDPLRTAHCGVYTCSCNIDQPNSTAMTTHEVVVQIPRPTVRLTRDPPSSQAVSTGDRLAITCRASISTFANTPTSIYTQWTDRSSLSDTPRVTVSPASSSPPYTSTVSISSLISSDTGTYECCVRAIPVGNPCVSQSDPVCRSINIAASLSVEITIDYQPPTDYEYTSPPYYRPCTPITLNCNAQRASGHVSYTWSSSNTASFVSGATSSSVSQTILTNLDGGSHTCCVRDGAGNSGCDRIEIFIKGHGLYVDDSQHISGVGVPNNSIVVPKTASCSECKLDVYCCSDQAGATMEFVYPDGVAMSTTNDYYNLAVVQSSRMAQVRMHNVLTDSLQLYGLYCCRITLRDETRISSVAAYSSLPGRPRVFSSNFEYDEHSESDCIVRITCSTSDSPPTTLQWFRDGQIIEMDGANYTSVQIVTDRRNMYYNNVLCVMNPCLVAGRHEFQCRVSNTQGSHTHSIDTNVPVYNLTEIRHEGSKFAGDRLVFTCEAMLPKKLKSLLPFIRIKWVGPPGVAMTINNMIDVGGVTYSECGLSRTLTFDPLKTDHSGLYRCVLSITKEELAQFFEREIRHDCAVITQALFQLQFGPVTHCSSWFDPSIAETLESNIKTAVANAINERCACDFHEGLIDMGEMSCHSGCSSECPTAVYRGRVTASVYTAEQLLGMVQDWLHTDGTFLFTHTGRTRLRLNPNCQPLQIASFSEPECGFSVKEISSKLFG